MNDEPGPSTAIENEAEPAAAKPQESDYTRRRFIETAGAAGLALGAGPFVFPRPARAQKKTLKILQWAIPVFAGWVIVLGAKHGEMQRPKNVLQGLLHRSGQ